ncbi:MAG: LysR family transcriptional regulator [Cyanobacteria bacterium J06598_4]
MDLATLKIFVEVMGQGSFAAVARERNVDPSSISRTISGLEQELGVRLFQRTTRKLSPTEAGSLYCDRISPLIAEMQQAIELVTESEQPQGTLRITASVSFGLKCLVPLLPSFEALYPDLAVELLLTDTRLDLVTERIDLAIRLGQLTDSSLIAQKLMSMRYAVCGSPNYLEQHQLIDKPQDIARHNCLLFPLAGYRTRWLFRDRQGKVTEVPVRGRTIISNAIGLQECAIAGMGLALLPHWLTDSEIEAGRLVKVLPDYDVTATDFNPTAWLLYPSRNYVPLKVKVFIDFCQQHLAIGKDQLRLQFEAIADEFFI